MSALMILTLLNEHRPLVGLVTETAAEKCPVSVKHPGPFSDENNADQE